MPRPFTARALLFAAAFVLAACPRATRPVPEAELGGLDLQVRREPTLRLIVEGEVAGRAAEVALEVAAPLTTVTTGCFAARPKSNTTVRVARLGGAYDDLPEIELPSAQLGDRALASRRVGLIEAPKCRLVLGADVLGRHRLRFDPAGWRVQLDAPRPRDAYQALEPAAGEELHLLPLSKDPETDRLIVPAAIRSAGRELIGGFVLATTASRSALAISAATPAGLVVDRELAPALPLPRWTRDALAEVATYTVDTVALSPRLSIPWLALTADARWTPDVAAGALGADVWGRFRMELDPQAQVLVLRRPKLSGRGERACEDATGAGEERCFSLEVAPAGADGFSAVAVAWRDLPEGGRLYLEALDPEGKPLRTRCRIGFSFGAVARGASVAQQFPWGELDRGMPACAAELRGAASARFSLFDEGPLTQCPGKCAFAQRVRGRQLVCSCAQAPGDGVPGHTDRALELFRRIRATQPAAAPEADEEEEEEEPDDGV